MLLNINCSAVTSIAVDLTFDDRREKHAVISLGDLIDVEYNKNGCRKRFQGKVISINAIGTDPKAWTIIVDGSGDFDSDKARFSPMNILDIEVIRKADTVRYIESPIDRTGIAGLRIVKGRLQYTIDGFNWHFIHVDRNNIVIRDEEGTMPDRDDFDYPDDEHYPRPPYHDRPRMECDEDVIKDEIS